MLGGRYISSGYQKAMEVIMIGWGYGKEWSGWFVILIASIFITGYLQPSIFWSWVMKIPNIIFTKKFWTYHFVKFTSIWNCVPRFVYKLIWKVFCAHFYSKRNIHQQNAELLGVTFLVILNIFVRFFTLGDCPYKW